MAVITFLLRLLLAPTALYLLTLVSNGIRGVLSHYTKRKLLRDVPGPTKSSFLTGHLHEFYNVSGLSFLESLSGYGGASKIHGLFGVRLKLLM